MKTWIRWLGVFTTTVVFLITLTPRTLSAQAVGDGAAGPVVSASSSESSPPLVSSTEIAATTGEGLRLNFRGVPLDTVLDYLSKAAGFVIIREGYVEGTVDVMSQQPLSEEETINLLNTVLNQKGYAAVRNGRVLTIVARSEAGKRNLPVKHGSNPEEIPKTDEMVTQIIPIRYGNAAGLVENLSPLIPSYATLTANESSNALILTDTQANVRRIAEIVQALDTSISNISAVKVFSLQYGDAKVLADVINQVFKSDTSGSSQGGRGQQMDQFFARMRGDRNDSPGPSGAGEARQAAARVVAVADEHTNSIVVCAPEDLMPTIESVIEEIDTTGTTITGVRVFRLRFADAKETAQLITDVFKPDSSSATAQRGRRFFGRGGGGPPPFMPPAEGTTTSQRKTQESTVVAVADVRTNSVVVTASQQTLDLVDQMVKELDSNPAREKKVFVHKMENADPDSVAAILRAMFPSQSTTTGGGTNTTGRGGGSGNRGTGSTRGSGNSGTGGTRGSGNSGTRGNSSSFGGGTSQSF
jgi:general secretion pathway protein D